MLSSMFLVAELRYNLSMSVWNVFEEMWFSRLQKKEDWWNFLSSFPSLRSIIINYKTSMAFRLLFSQVLGYFFTHILSVLLSMIFLCFATYRCCHPCFLSMFQKDRKRPDLKPNLVYRYRIKSLYKKKKSLSKGKDNGIITSKIIREK